MTSINAILLVVNAGPVALCESFLAPSEVTKFPFDLICELRAKMDSFVKLCAFAVKFHKVTFEDQLLQF